MRCVNPGSYFHLGIMNGLNSMFKDINLINIPNIIEVSVNIDGLPLLKSSSSQLYPILCIVNNVKIQPNIFPIGIYHGTEKPIDFNDMLSDFVDESLKLTTDVATQSLKINIQSLRLLCFYLMQWQRLVFFLLKGILDTPHVLNVSKKENIFVAEYVFLT